MKRRGVELSMNVIIIAAIALIVLVILVLLVTNSTRQVQQGTGCAAKPQGQCVELFDESCADVLGEGFTSGGSLDCSTDAVCCYKPL